MNRVVLLFLLGGFAALVNASEVDTCRESEYRIVGDFLKSKGFKKSGNANSGVPSSDCKVWPYDKRYTIAAFGYVPSRKSRFDEDSKIIFIGLIDNQTRRVVSSHWEELIEDALDALNGNSLKLDTARYQLNGDTRAIGLRYNSAAVGARCADAGFEDQLTLFVRKGERLQPVFKRYMRQYRAIKGCIGMATENDEIETADLSISIGDGSHKGYKDLVVAATLDPPEKAKEEFVLAFDGKQYRLPKNAPWWLGGTE